MNANNRTYVLIQGALSVLLLAMAFGLLITGRGLPEWLVVILITVMATWFGSGAYVRHRTGKTGKLDKVLVIRQKEDGSWEQVDGP